MKAHDLELVGDDIIIQNIRSGLPIFVIKTAVGEVGITVSDNGSVGLYHDGLKVSETTVNGISGAVWG